MISRSYREHIPARANPPLLKPPPDLTIILRILKFFRPKAGIACNSLEKSRCLTSTPTTWRLRRRDIAVHFVKLLQSFIYHIEGHTLEAAVDMMVLFA